MAIDTVGMNRELLRISGLSSGLDTDAIVSSLLKIEQYKVDRQFSAKTKLEWKRDAFRDINLMLRSFREDTMSVLKPEYNMLSASSYNQYEVTMLDTTNAVKITAGASANTDNLTINNISQLAEAAEAEALNVFNTGDMSVNTALKDLDLATPLTFVDNEISFSINGEAFTFSEDALLSDVISTVNANENADVTMRYSSLKKGLSFTSDSIGSASTLDIVNIKGNAFDATAAAFGVAEGTYTGQDAILEIENITVTKSTNTFSIDGISYTLRDTSATEISFNVERNVQDTVDRVKSFIDKYNELIGTLQSKIEEPVYRSYDPLTDEQRDSLSDSQAEKWEEMAKSGLLHNDSNISNLLNNLRESFYSTIEGVGLRPSDIGLRTGSYQDKGKIFIDEDTLRQAIENNPQQVEDIFVKSSTSTDDAINFSESGLMRKISTLTSNYEKNAKYTTIVDTESEISRAETRLEKLMDTMSRTEARYWAKFTAMETALARMNSQTSSILSQLGMSAE